MAANIAAIHTTIELNLISTIATDKGKKNSSIPVILLAIVCIDTNFFFTTYPEIMLMSFIKAMMEVHIQILTGSFSLGKNL